MIYFSRSRLFGIQLDQIEPYKIIALNRVGFNWDPRENYWMERFEELKSHFQSLKGKKRVMPNRKVPLGVWCDGQVLEYNKFKTGSKPCYITKERIKLLNSIGFVWDRTHASWMASYEELKKFQADCGHTQVSVNYGDKTLFRWVSKQKRKYKNMKEGKKPTMTEEQLNLLRAIKFFQPERRYPSDHHGRRYRPRNKGRPKSSSLIPQEEKKSTDETNNTIVDGAPSTDPFTPTGGTVTPSNIPMPQLHTLPVNEEFNEITHGMADKRSIENNQLNENRNLNEEIVHREFQLDREHNDVADRKIPSINTDNKVHTSESDVAT